ncbi:uncharacterized protein [Clytia hemisphaerica]|uniref:uncharacterized protein n=1 Tax=Clytia hemisphaerica TaxID=252671 RepID=UPI0034D74113
MEQDLAEKDQQISPEVKKTQDEISKIELEKSKILEASSNQERKLQESIFNLKVDLKSSQSAMEILKRDFLKQTDSMMNEQSEKLSSKHEFEKKQLEATITAKERHLNEAILSIQHEAESTSRELFQANLDKQRFQDQLEKLNERCHVQAVAYIRRTGELTADLEQLSAELAKCKEDHRIALAEIAKTKDIEISQVREEHQITLDILKQRADEIGILSEKLRQAEEQNNIKLSKQSQLSDDLKKALEDGRVAMETITQRFEQQLEEAAKQHQVDMSSIKNERHQLSSALSQCKKDHEEAIEITQQQSSDIESYKEEIQQLADRINDLENRNKDLTRENSSLDTSNENKKYVMKLNSLKMSLDKAQRLMELNIMPSSAPSKGTSIHKTDSESASVSSVSISNSIHFGARPTVSHVDVENMRQSISRLASTYRLDSETEFAIQQMIASVLDLTKYRTSDTFIPGDNECSTTPGSQLNVDNCAPLSNTASVTENIESTTEFSANITDCSDSNSKCTGLKSAGDSKSSLTRHSVKNVDDYEPTTSSKLLLSGTGADLTESTQSFVQATESDPRYINASAPPHEACTLHSTKSSAVMLKTVASESLEFDIVIEVPITSPEVANMDPASPIYYHTGSSDLLRQLNSKTELPIDRDSQASIEPYMLAGMSSRTAFNAMDDEEDDSFEIISTFTTSGQSKCLTKEKSSLANDCQSTIADRNHQIVSAFHTDSQVSIETYMSSLTNVKVCSPVPSQAAVPIAKVVSTEDKHNLVKSYGKITSAPVTVPAITDIPPPEDDSTSVKTPRFSPQERALREKKLIECQRQMFREYYEDKRRQEEEERKQKGDGSDTSDSDCESPTTSQQNIYEASPSFHNTMKRTYSRSSSRLSCVASNNTLERYRPSTSQTVLENITEQDETAELVDSSPVKPQATQAIDHTRSSSSLLARSESHTTPAEPTHYLYGSLSGQRIRRMKKSPEQIAEFEANRARLRKEMLACRKETRNFLDELSDLSDDELYNN